MSEENEGLRSPWSELVTLATRVAEERRELVAAYNALVDELRRCSARRMRAEARLAALTALEMENKELRQRIRQFEFCIGRVAIALGGVCCGGVDVTLQHLQADPHSTTRVLCDAIAALREEGK